MEDPGIPGGSDLLEKDDRLRLPAAGGPGIAVGRRPQPHAILPFEHLESRAGNEERLRARVDRNVGIFLSPAAGSGENVDLVTAATPPDAAHVPMMSRVGHRRNSRQVTIPAAEARSVLPLGKLRLRRENRGLRTLDDRRLPADR